MTCAFKEHHIEISIIFNSATNQKHDFGVDLFQQTCGHSTV